MNKAKRTEIFERLRDEHGYGGGLTVVMDYVRIARGRLRETFGGVTKRLLQDSNLPLLLGR